MLPFDNSVTRQCMILGARRFKGGQVNGNHVDPSYKVLCAFPMHDRSGEGNAVGFNVSPLVCASPQVFDTVAGQSFPCIGQVITQEHSDGNGKMVQIVQEVAVHYPLDLTSSSKSNTAKVG